MGRSGNFHSRIIRPGRVRSDSILLLGFAIIILLLVTPASASSEIPVASFTANVTNGTVPLTIRFTDTSTGLNITAWNWSFGDGSFSSLQNPVNTYMSAGSYAVSLI